MLACRSSRPRPSQASDAVEGMLAGPMQVTWLTVRPPRWVVFWPGLIGRG